MTPPAAMMARARAIALDETAELPPLATQIRRAEPLDPLDGLADRARLGAAHAVDALQLAAYLEADGLTDRVARVEYGYADVFALAEEVFRRVGNRAVRPRSPVRPHVARGLRPIGHGLLYLLPAAVFPAVLAVLGARSLVLGIVLAGALGWVWSGATAWLAYQLLGNRDPGGAGRLLRWSTLVALPASAAVAAVVVATTDASPGLIALATGQMAFQMATTTLVFYRREGLLIAAMAPAVGAGVLFLFSASPKLTATLAVVAASVTATLAVALRQTFGRDAATRPRQRMILRGRWRTFAAVVVFTVLSATYLLHAQARFLFGQVDVAVAALPLIVGMGMVEWRAHRFTEQARALLARVSQPRQFVVRVWLLLVGGLAVCLVAVSLLAVLLLVALARSSLLSSAGVVMAGASVVLSGAYFLGFLLANQGRYGWLCGSLLLCLGVHAVARYGSAWYDRRDYDALSSESLWYADQGATSHAALTDTVGFLCSTLLLLILYLIALSGRLGQARHYR